MTSTVADFDGPVIAPPTDSHCRDVLDPWVIESLPIGGDRARSIIHAETDRFRRKVRRKLLKAFTGLGRPISAFRTSRYVKSEYERIWSSYEWPSTDGPLDGRAPVYATWGDELLLVRKGGLNHMELERICAVIEQAGPESVLEIGCGTGRNLLALSAIFPDLRLAGYELSEAGVAVARSVQAEPELPEVIARFCPRPAVDRTAHRRIAFDQGNAAALPAQDKSFDIVFTRLALEQMELIKTDVLAEIRRVARRAVILMEPFNDSNRTELLQLSKKAKNHFSMDVAELALHGLEPLAYFDDWPQKLKEGAGLAVARPV